jgi:hypothetical protein
MKLVSPTHVTQHRLKRFIAWATLTLVWTVQFLFSNAVTHKRQIRQRWRGFDRLARAIGAMLIVRAIQLYPLRRHARTRRDHLGAKTGFRRRRAPGFALRAILGARLRKQLFAHDPFRRLGLLLSALRNFDKLAARLGARARRGLTRLRALTPTRPPHDAPPVRVSRAVACADSS